MILVQLMTWTGCQSGVSVTKKSFELIIDFKATIQYRLDGTDLCFLESILIRVTEYGRSHIHDKRDHFSDLATNHGGY